MTEVLPAILEKDLGAVKEKLGRIEGLVRFAQLDITDGKFVPGVSWQNPADFDAFKTAIKFDLHLMVERPEKWISNWIHASVFRLTFHYEASIDVRRTARLVRQAKKEVAIALKLETPLSVIDEFADEIDLILLMAVDPGAQGRKFDPRVTERVEKAKQSYPNLKIGVDGGVDNLTAEALVAAGADVLVSGSYIFESEGIREAIALLTVEK